MQILVDQGFPAYVDTTSSANLTVGRWTGEAVSDAELIEFAAGSGFSAVVFLGQAEVRMKELRDLAERNSVALVGTVDTDPAAAAFAIGGNLTALLRRVRPGAVLVVRSRDIVDVT